MNEAPSIAPGTILDGRYRITRHVGTGGFGTVFEAVHLALAVPVAVKVFKLSTDPLDAERETKLEAFAIEARLLTRLRHDNVVRTFDQGVCPGGEDGLALPYVVMEWCGDEALDKWLERHRESRLPFAELLRVFSGIAAGVAHAHAEGIAHRDLKPSNIMMVTSAQGDVSPRIIDFGIAKSFERSAEPSASDTRTFGAVVYTPAYAAPEQAVGARTGPWTDVHALGLILVELLTGKAPYGEAGSISLAIIDPVRPSPAALGVRVGPLEPVIARALALKPQDRYRDAGELCAAIDSALASPGLESTMLAETLLADPVAARADLGSRPSVAKRGVAWAVIVPSALLLVASGVGGGFLLTRRGQSDHSEAANPRGTGTARDTTTPARSAAPRASASVAPKNAEPRLASLTTGDVVARMEHAALAPLTQPDRSAPTARLMIDFQAGPATGAVYLNHVSVPAALPREGAPLAALWEVRSWIVSDKSQGFGLVYAVEGDWVISMSWSPVADTRALLMFDTLVDGLTFDARGSSFSGANPAFDPGASKVLWVAKTPGGLSDVELAFRLEATGAAVKATILPSEWVFAVQRGVDRGELRVFPSTGETSGEGELSGGAQSLLKSLRGRKARVSFVSDAKVIVIATGTGDFGRKAFLEEVLTGVAAPVTSEP